jgi:hypothetical protein
MKRIFAAIAAAVLVTMATTGCMKINMNLNVAADDTVSGSAVVGFSKEVYDALKSSGGDTSKLDSEGMFAEKPGVTVKNFDDGKFVGTEYAFKAVPLKNFAASSESTDLSVTRDGDNLIVSGSLDTSGGDSTVADAKENPFTKAFFKDSEMTVVVTLPGEIKSTNGEKKGNTITWSGQIGDKITFDAVAYSPKGIDPILVSMIVGGVAIVGASILLFFYFKKRKPLVSEVAE